MSTSVAPQPATTSTAAVTAVASADAPKPRSPHRGCCATCRRLNRNVRLVLVYATLLSCYSSLVSQTPLSAYILLMRPNDYASVGVATGIQGIVSLVVAFPAGAIADRIGRQQLLRVAAVMALLTAASPRGAQPAQPTSRR